MKKITTILALLLAQNCYALELTGVNGVEILAINGKEVNSSFFSKDNTDIEAGKHQVVVRYTSQFNNDEIVESRPAIFTLDLKQDTKISVEQMNNQRQAEKKIKAGLTWQVVSEDKQYEIKNSDTLKGQGFMPYSDIEKLIITYNEKQNITLATAPVVATTAVATKTAPQVTDENALVTLYQQSSKEQKKAFRLWLLDQDMQ